MANRLPVLVSGFINDGYNMQGFITGVKFRYPDVHFDYRPPSPGDRAVILAEVRKVDARKSEELAAMAICKYLQWWDLKDNDGKELDCKDPKTLLGNGKGHTDQQISQKLWEIVVLGVTSDIDPTWELEAKRDVVPDSLSFLKPTNEEGSNEGNS